MMDFDHPVNGVPKWATEDGIAQIFTRRYSHEWSYCPKKKWVRWTGSQWEPDQVSLVLQLIRLICREAGERVSPHWLKVQLGRWSTIAAVERFVRDDYHHAFNPTDCALCSRLHLCPVGRKNARLRRTSGPERRRSKSPC
jgi:D5 N terminal like